MEEINLKDFNHLFAEEMNKSTLVQKHMGVVNPKDVQKLHLPISYRMTQFLFSHFPAVLNFGKYFYLFSKHANTIEKYKLDNKHVEKRKASKKSKKLSSKDSVHTQWTKQLGPVKYHQRTVTDTGTP